MDRRTVSLGTEEGNACVLDRSSHGQFGCTDGRAGDPALSTPRADTVLPRSTACAQTDLGEETSQGEQTVVLREVWSRLSMPDRQRFGHHFSFMVLKALGLRPCSAQEVPS
jgi:hypothetical protein